MTDFKVGDRVRWVKYPHLGVGTVASPEEKDEWYPDDCVPVRFESAPNFVPAARMKNLELVETDLGRTAREYRESVQEKPLLTGDELVELFEDDVHHPAHYNSHPSGIEAHDITKHLNNDLGNVAKYTIRHRHKGHPLQDLKKALKYAEFERDSRGVEEWRVFQPDDRYEISSFGKVRNRETGNERKLAPITKMRYLSWVTTPRDGFKHRCFYAHREVAREFLGEIPDGYHVAHIDGNPQNNSVWNLRICTPADNIADKSRHGTQLRGEAVSTSRLTRDEVRGVRLLTEAGWTRWQVAEFFEVSEGAVNHITLGHTWRPDEPSFDEQVARYLEFEPDPLTRDILTALWGVNSDPSTLEPLIDALEKAIAFLEREIRFEETGE